MLLALVGSAFATGISLDNHTYNAGNVAASGTKGLTYTATAGDWGFVVITANYSSITAVPMTFTSDSGGSTWNSCSEYPSSALGATGTLNYAISCFYTKNMASTSGTLTFTNGSSSATARADIYFADFVGVPSTMAFDTAAMGSTPWCVSSTNGTALTCTSSGSVSGTNELILAVGVATNCSSISSWTAGTGYAITNSDTGGSECPSVLEWKNDTSASGTETATITVSPSSAWGEGLIMLYQPAATAKRRRAEVIQ